MPLHISEHVYRLGRGHATITPPEMPPRSPPHWVRLQWLPSAVNVHAGRLSSTLDPADIQVSREALRLLRSWFSVEPQRPTFRYCRMSLGHPKAQRLTTLSVLSHSWEDDVARLLNPLLDLVSLKMYKLAKDDGKVLLVLPDWQN